MANGKLETDDELESFVNGVEAFIESVQVAFNNQSTNNKILRDALVKLAEHAKDQERRIIQLETILGTNTSKNVEKPPTPTDLH